jgi:hypothetical protein
VLLRGVGDEVEDGARARLSGSWSSGAARELIEAEDHEEERSPAAALAAGVAVSTESFGMERWFPSSQSSRLRRRPHCSL